MTQAQPKPNSSPHIGRARPGSNGPGLGGLWALGPAQHITTRPTFYLVPVTHELSDAVITGQWPKVETEVLKCVTVAGHNRRVSEGMETPEYRRVALQRMIAFKVLAESQWESLI